MTKKLLFIAFYPIGDLGSAPKVRINALKKEFEKRVDLVFINGEQFKRLVEYSKVILSTRLRNISKCYVEPSTSSAYPWDIIFLVYLKLRGINLSIYIRDAYPMFKEFWKQLKLYQLPLYLGWHVSFRIYHCIADITYYPTRSLMNLFKPKNGKLLPPGSGKINDKFSANSNKLLYTGNLNYRYGLPLMLEVIEKVKNKITDFDWVVVSHSLNHNRELGSGISIINEDLSNLVKLNMKFFAGIIPLIKTKYNDLALPVKLFDYLSWGLPIIATNCSEQKRFIMGNKIGDTFPDKVKELSDGIIKIHSEKSKLKKYHQNVLGIVEKDHHWNVRVEKILEDFNNL